MDAISILLLFATVCGCIFIAIVFRTKKNSIDGKTIPGPKPLPLIGNALDVDFRRLHISLSDMVGKYGPIFQINLLGQTAIVINDVELEKKAFGSAKYGDVFNDRPDAFWGKYVCFDCSDIVFADANKKTHTKRKMLHRSLKFYGDGIAHFESLHEDELHHFVETLKLTNQCDFNIHDMVTQSLSNTLIMLLIGKPPENNDYGTIEEICDTGNVFFSGMGFVYDFMPFIRYLPGPVGNLYRRAIVAREQILNRCYFPVRDFNKISTEEEPGLVNSLIKLQKEINEEAGTEFVTEADIKAIVFEVIGASQATTSTVIINAFALMLTHPHVARKVQEEIDKVVGSDRLPCYPDKENMHYTMATTYEVLRYTTPVALNIPHQAAMNQNFEGYFVAKDSIILSNHWFIHHDPRLWDEPWVFKPERFLDHDGKLLPLEDETRRNLVPFSTGHRECIGERFAKSTICLYLAAVLQSFDIEPASDGHLPDTDPRNYRTGVNVKVESHFCRFIPRQ